MGDASAGPRHLQGSEAEAYLHDTQTETLVVDCVLDRSRHRYCFDVALGLGGVVTRSTQANAGACGHAP